MNPIFKKIVNYIGSPKIFVYLVIWLMVLVVAGTLAQRDYGLYVAQQKYFSSWFLNGKEIPNWFSYPNYIFPSGRLIMTIMIINLSCYFLRPNIFKKSKIGITIVHSGVVLLLLGGALTAIFSSEGSMVVEEGKQSNFIENFYLKEFAIVNSSNEQFDEFTIFDQPLLKRNSILKDNNLPFKIRLLEYFDNVEAVPRLYVADSTFKGMAKNFTLNQKNNEKEFEKNIPGMFYEVIDLNDNVLGVYIAYMGQPVTQTINIDDIEYSLILRRNRTYLPFYIHLNDFRKVMHPGTNIAKSYSSDISLLENNVSRDILIKMNEPLRYKGYTFYQASFIEGELNDTSVLAVVKNYGRLFPYISSIIMCFGLLVHMILKIDLRFKRIKSES